MLVMAACLVVGPALYAAAPTIWRRLGLPMAVRKDLPFRDPWRYWLTPWKAREDSAGQFARAALRAAKPGSIVIADGTSYPPLAWTQRVDRIGPGVVLLRIAEATPARLRDATGPIYLVSHTHGCYPRWLDGLEGIEYDREPVLLRVRWKPRGASSDGHRPR